MNYKVQGTIDKNKKYFIIYAILWLFCVIVFVMPACAGITESNINGIFDFSKFLTETGKYFTSPLSSLGKVFLPNYISDFLSVLWKFSLIYIIIAIIGIIRNSKKSEYEDIEHGSSDWSQRGEQYRVLSNKKGIILGQNNYLPVDKRGNVNVLVVGRFRFW